MNIEKGGEDVSYNRDENAAANQIGSTTREAEKSRYFHRTDG